MSPEPANRQEIDVLACLAGLKLTDEYLEELVQAYGYVEQMLIRPLLCRQAGASLRGLRSGLVRVAAEIWRS